MIQESTPAEAPVSRVSAALERFTRWLHAYGETSRDHQSFFAGPIGGRAKALYYRNKLLGTAAVAPMIFCEAVLPAGRRLFHRPTRFPIADAHYAMGFAFLYEATGEPAHLKRAIHFLDELKKSRCPDFKEYCWGYPFDWVTRNGTIKAQTPLITTTPYVFEAFLQVYRLCNGGGLPSALRPPPSALCPPERLGEWKGILESIALHATTDIKDFKVSETASTCSYTPYDKGGVINSAAYRGLLLTSASKFLSNDEYQRFADRNVNFVLENQNPDGSWFYALDGVRDFVDHFHTCFVMKALAKVYLQLREPSAESGERRVEGAEQRAEGGEHGVEDRGQRAEGRGRKAEVAQRILAALERGVEYYLKNLFAEDGLPKPFSKAPRLTVYKRELYDCAECINLCVLLRDRFPELDAKLETVVSGILKDWIKPDGSFRSRQLLLGWDNVPMHRWAQSQMFRNLAFYLRERQRTPMPKVADQRTASRQINPNVDPYCNVEC